MVGKKLVAFGLVTLAIAAVPLVPWLARDHGRGEQSPAASPFAASSDLSDSARPFDGAYVVARRYSVKLVLFLQCLDRLLRPSHYAQTLPSPWYQFEDVQYFKPGPEFKLTLEAAALKRYVNSEGHPSDLPKP